LTPVRTISLTDPAPAVIKADSRQLKERAAELRAKREKAKEEEGKNEKRKKARAGVKAAPAKATAPLTEAGAGPEVAAMAV
jgi:hypothetical protein